MPLTFHRLLKICGHLKKGGGGGGGGMEDFFSECRVKSYWITALKVNDRPLAEWMIVRGGGTLCSSSMAVMHRKLALFYIALNAALSFLYPPTPTHPPSSTGARWKLQSDKTQHDYPVFLLPWSCTQIWFHTPNVIHCGYSVQEFAERLRRGGPPVCKCFGTVKNTKLYQGLIISFLV